MEKNFRPDGRRSIISPIVRISIVVPAFNEEKLLAFTLQAIRQASRGFEECGWETEVIVCNNNSTDRTAEVAAREGARVVFEPVNQIGRARNTGAAHATGEWLIFIDADSVPSRELFLDVAACIRAGRHIGGGSTIRMDVRIGWIEVVASIWNGISRVMRCPAGSFIFCEANAFRSIGGFSLHLFASEELDLAKRLKRFGRRSGKSLRILHRHPLTTSARKARLYSVREHLAFLIRTILRGGRTLRSSAACHTWYDGRR
jgi:glycosyltransferase involved in cell wall biosynthesis